jgi:hypothetical protein
MGSSLLLKGGTNTPTSIVESFSVANTFVPGDAVRYDIPSSTWVKAQADSAENSEVAGVVSSASFNTFDLTYAGLINVSTLSGVSAPVLFLDSTTAGGLTTSPPSAIGTVIKPVLTKTTNGSGYIVTNYLGTQIGGSSTVAIDEIQPVGTVVPFAGSVIPDSWLECNGNSYAVGTYPNLYAKLQNSSGDRAPAYGHVAVLTVGAGPFNIIPSVGSHVISDSTPRIRARVIATTATTCTVQTVPVYSTTTKNFINNNVVFGAGLLIVEGGTPSTVETIQFGTFLNVSAVATTHFNTPDLRGRFALGVNTARLPTINDLENDTANNSAISGNYSMGSQGGEEKNSLPTAGAATSTGTNCVANVPGDLLNNIPPYTVVRYIIKASPYTRAAIIDGIDIPYTSLLVGDLRDGSLRPNGSGEALVFKTNDGTSGVERMRLTNTGNLIIGSSSSSDNNPGHKFIVSSGAGSNFEVLPGYLTDTTILQMVNRPAGVYETLDLRAKDFLFSTSSGSVPVKFRINPSGQVNIPVDTESTSLSTGGLTLGGGAGIAKNLTVGGGISAAGGITFSGLTRVTNTTASTSTAIGALTVAGGVGVGGALFANAVQANSLNASVNTPSTNTGSGSLVVAGGAGIGGALNVGGGISAAGSLNVVGAISASGTLTVTGGITAARLDCSGVMKSGSISTGTFTANTLNAAAGDQSNSVSSGALVVTGGAGIGGALHVGGGITAANLDLASGAIRTSGSINCGNITSAGTFQAGSLNATSVSASTNTGSGSLVVVGGVGIGKNLIVGEGISAAGGITFSGITRVLNATPATSTSVAALTVAGGAGIAGALYVGGITAAGGISMGGALNVGGAVAVSNATSSTSTTSGALIVAGGAGIAGALYVGAIQTQTLNAASSTASSSTTSGALTVVGGVGIGKNLIVGDGISAAGGITFSGITRVLNATSATSTGVAALTVAGGAGIAGGLIVGGSVGVGTAPTSAKLEILGSTVAQAEAFRLSAGTSSQVGLRLYEDSDAANFLRFRPFGTPQKGFMFTNDGDTAILTVDSLNLRVGIGAGAAAPTEALDVVGNIKASGGISGVSASVGSGGIFTRLSNNGIQTNGNITMNGGGVLDITSLGNFNPLTIQTSEFESTMRFKDFWTGNSYQGKGPQIGSDANRFIIRTFDTTRVTITSAGVGISNVWIPTVTTFGWSRVQNATSGFAPLSNGIRAPLINSADGIANQKYSMLVYLTSYNYDPGDSLLIRRYDDIPANALLLFANDSGALYSINGVVQLDGNGVPVATGNNGWRSAGSVVFYRTT